MKTKLKSILLSLKTNARILTLAAISACVAMFPAGCASKGSGPSFVLKQPKPDEAIVYHYRTYAIGGSARAYDVVANDRLMAQIGSSGFFEQSVVPGLVSYRSKISYHSGPIAPLEHAIINSFQDFKEAYSFQAEPGKVYFLRWKAQRNSDLPEITPVPEAEALRDLSSLQSFPPVEKQ